MKLKCDLIVQNLNNLALSQQTSSQEKLHKSAQIGLYRHRQDEDSEEDLSKENGRKLSVTSQSSIVLTIEAKTLSLKFKLKSIETYTRFIQEGKATLKLIDENIFLLISNTTPLTLINFISFLNIKMVRNVSSIDLNRNKNQDKTSIKSYANKLLSNAQFSIGKNFLTNISPLCEKEVNDVMKTKASNLTKNSKHSQSPVRAGTSMIRHNTFNHSPTTKPKLKRSISSLIDSEANKDKNITPKLTRQVSSTSNLFVQLEEEQKLVLRAIKDGKNVFFTGSGGSGKSFLIAVIKKTLNHETSFVTASTGVAASLIGGITLHAFAGIGAENDHDLINNNNKKDEDFESNRIKAIITRINNSRDKLNNWKKCKQLIIDEISMIDGDLFDTLDLVGR
jgi:ATP-dependent DNA helicase PIF1